MITQLYVFSPGSYVVAEEWNSNFRVLYQTASAHTEAINDAYATIAFPDSDMSGVFAQVRARDDSHFIPGTAAVVAVDIAASHEYYKTLATGQDLFINISQTMNGEARILLQLQEDRQLMPFDAAFAGGFQGEVIINHYNNYVFRAGFYYIMIYVTNGVAQLKLIWTGVNE
jgi:hypothetical protein